MVTKVVTCRHCGSTNVVKNGFAPNGKQKYLCHACGRQSRESPSPNGYTEGWWEEILRVYQKRSSRRGLRRTFFGVSPTTVIASLKKAYELDLKDTLVRPRTPREYPYTSRVLKGWDRMPPTLSLICVVLLAVWMADTNGGYFVSDWAPPALILAALALFVSVGGFLEGTRLRRSTLALGLFAAYTAWTFASLLWSPNMGDAWLGVGQTIFYLLAFWVTVVFVALGASRRGVLTASVLGSTVVAALTLAALGSRPENLLDEDGRLAGTVGYYGGEAAFLLVPFWISVYLAGSRHINPVLRGAMLVGAVLNIDLAVLTQSRGAVAAMAASLIAFFLLSGQRLRGLLALVPIAVALYVAFPGLNGIFLTSSEGEASVETLLSSVLPTVWLTATGAGLYGLCWGLADRRWSPPRSTVRIVAGIVLIGGAIFLAVGVATLVERAGDPAALAQQKWEAFKTNDQTGQEQSRYLSVSGNARYGLWQVAWKDFTTHPVLGVGIQNYEATYYQLRENIENYVFSRQPHSLPLEVLSERGIVGGVLFFGLLATCLAVGLWERFKNLGSEGKAQVGALVAAVIYWFVYSSAEWFWQIPAVTLLAIVYLALLVSPWRGVGVVPESSERLIWPLRAAGVGVAMLAVAVITPLYVADHYLKRSQAATDPAEGLEMVERAQWFNPLNPTLPEREAELAIETREWDRVEQAYDRAIQLNPEHYVPYMFLATFHERRGEFEKALLHYQKALALNPQSKDLNQRIERLKSQREADDLE